MQNEICFQQRLEPDGEESNGQLSGGHRRREAKAKQDEGCGEERKVKDAVKMIAINSGGLGLN